jgi:dTDP-4-amino-4,6-dideoxygalactose transaminase
MVDKFTGSFIQQSELPKAAFEKAHEVLSSARLHRYGSLPDTLSESAQLEIAYAKYQGAEYCLACTSGGQALQIALRAAGVKHGDKVLTNGFTLAPVPGSIQAVGGKVTLVEINEDLVIDCNDLEAKAKSSGAKFLMLSHMRGHLADMDRIVEICDTHKIILIEDCAHTMGATWSGIKSGNFGHIGCFSTQTYKHINSGEGGLLTTNDPAIIGRAMIMSGSYMNYERHGTVPDAKYFEDAKYDCPNMSARMDNLRAAILLPQIDELDQAILDWNKRYDIIAEFLIPHSPKVILPKSNDKAIRVASSIQFRVPNLSNDGALKLIDDLYVRGVEIKWFGRNEPAGFTSMHNHWHYVESQKLPATDRYLKDLFDMRLPLSFSLDDCKIVGQILADEIQKA